MKAACLVAILATALALEARSQSSFDELARSGRAAVLQHQTLAPYEIETLIDEAIRKASALPEGPERLKRVRESLESLRPIIGSLDGLPSVKLQTFLGVAAAREDDRRAHFHAKYIGALVAALTRERDGRSAATAIPVTLIEDEYAYFDIDLDVRVRPEQRVTREIGGRVYDVWTLDDRKVYFDVTDIRQAFSRILNAREAKQKETETEKAR